MEENKEKKLTYEQLENVANQLSMQLQETRFKLAQINTVVTKLPFLFKVVEIGDKVFNSDFVSMCGKEIENLLTPEEESTEEKNVSNEEA